MLYDSEELSEILKNMAIALGAFYVGIATNETLKKWTTFHKFEFCIRWG